MTTDYMTLLICKAPLHRSSDIGRALTLKKSSKIYLISIGALYSKFLIRPN